MKPESVKRLASELMANIKITSTIARLRATAQAQAVLKVQDLINELEQARIMALKNLQCSAAIAATIGG
jgi:cytoplasmic iron level regulating protein YaaA (DUF328/UPF0246 family)